MQHVELPDGARLAVRTWGERSDGPPLLLLHGLGEASLAAVEAGHHVHSSEPAAFLQVVRPFLATPTQG